MEIGPVSESSSTPPSKKDKAQSPPPAADQGFQDKAEISLESRRRILSAAEEASTVRDDKVDSELAKDQRAQAQREDKLALVKSRIETGYYSRPEIIDEIADRLIDEMG
jgi:hypothetical protein